MPAPVVISLGGSIVAPQDIDTRFLRAFRQIILDRVRRGERFILIVGGGDVSRRYQRAAKRVIRLTGEDVDWLGIHATRLNAHLLRTIFREHTHPRLITNKRKIRRTIREPIIVAAGFRPGSSTDYDAVLLARAYGAKRILNLSNIRYVYDRDPRKHPDATPQRTMTWPAFRKLVGDRWDPGAHVPFDPVASKLAAKLRLEVVIAKGTDTANLRRMLAGKSFRGTVIR